MKILRIIFLCLVCSLSAETQPFALITIPKAGSHLIIKALDLMTGTKPIWHTQFPSFFYVPSEYGYLYTHFCVSPQLEQNYADLPKLKKIIMIRDLRDVCVSIVRQICKAPWPGLSGERREWFKALPFDKQLLFVINRDYDIHDVAAFAPNSMQLSTVRIAKQAVRYANNANHLVCRYEDLVGPLGGGTRDAQMGALRAIAAFLELPEISEWQLSEIADQLYGDTFDPFGGQGLANFRSTFRKGQIGGWKERFKPEHMEAFKKKLGKYQVELGYENEDW